MSWEIEVHQEAEAWLLGLPANEFAAIGNAIDQLAIDGPRLGRPLVGEIKGSRHHNMKELRSIGGNLRVLFVFDPQRTAILLVGGDKTDDWLDWYRRNVPIADDRYDQHLRDLGP